ncbi:glycoside hydrolase family 55 protein [Phanerochaete carnosa HHB-10118-sp]|uniref:Glycoside hydrolase family 55 protein n=1 Tax=Phanerochaete carnosa (strain HHB-10118-sp) TaxID=650164 RepID=K5VVB4_PHACS|nr:glycoside hydrolase family 55 protein [Phanerochaete carnosa HHB-10118-sp]EKM55463.1 glycoside hydrolase family 55 protein [Phanerochaete carnosa HHB-10118-sp]
MYSEAVAGTRDKAQLSRLVHKVKGKFSGRRSMSNPQSSQAMPLASALNSTCSSPLGAGTAGPNDPFWLENIKHQGTAPFNSDASTYQVFRNVKDFGAKGDGVTDDTAAINAAISTGVRCGLGCNSTSTSPAVVYFPSGTYLVSTPIIALYYTALVGDARNLPTLLASANFSGMAVIDADPYIPNGGGAQYYVNQNNFFRSVRNFVIDLTKMPASATATGLHWQVSQATSLINVVVNMSTASGNNHQGMFMENGSGGFMGDLVFNGGKFGIWIGNQQFTVRNITVNNANSAIFSIWNWGWTFQGVTINNCQVGFDLTTGGVTLDQQTVGAIAVIDATVVNTPIFIRNSKPSSSLAGSLVLNNINLQNVPTAVGVVGGETVLAGGTTTIQSWGQGNIYNGTSSTAQFVKSNIAAPTKASSLLDGSGRIFGRPRPQYTNYAVDQFISVKTQGAKGDGKTDDTAALQAVFDQFSGCKIIFFDAGVYFITNTLTIPAGTQMVGEGWSVIMGGGSAFSNMNSPTVIVQAGAPGSSGILEITDIVFTTQGPAPGAVLMEWNVNSPTQGGAGMWDTHFRLGGAAGTNLQSNCLPGADTTQCTAAYTTLHLTSGSNAYLEGSWLWVADHDMDGSDEQLTIFAGRGLLSESQGPVWLVGTSVEHHTLYQYNLQNASDHYMGLIQTETPYYQPTPALPTPFSVNASLGDPDFPNQQSSWALVVQNSKNILVFGAGLYSFFQNFGQACLNSSSCQEQILNVDSTSTIWVYSLSTVGVTHQLSVGNQAVIPQSQNVNGFQSTVTAWSQ